MSYKTYAEARAHGGKDVWPGCGRSGSCRPCGGIHDFERRVGLDYFHDFRCLVNNEYGCPQPKPEAEHDFNRLGRCRTCGTHRSSPQ